MSIAKKGYKDITLKYKLKIRLIHLNICLIFFRSIGLLSLKAKYLISYALTSFSLKEGLFVFKNLLKNSLVKISSTFFVF